MKVVIAHALAADPALSAIHPNDPHAIYISTATNPQNDTQTFGKHS
jgi:hypothetical protein